MKSLGIWMLGLCLTIGTIGLTGCAGGEADTPADTTPAVGDDGAADAGSDAKEAGDETAE
ncbi:hypothetical protein [Adhaeretor mobilis]|uniref:Uncharacterized protein n=1 Tax=Adhaeretor mobilis TaxID=1930276 RepID=A0A517MXZ2_9BACT|nr:hypothetical protein [Adhaeretor mobilis]QDS99739.1 hypothetical protein HG15A2_30690 [Adhaeretor mobilis]